MERPDFNKIFMAMAVMLSQRSECNRTSPYAHTGALITKPSNRQIIGFGYNGREIHARLPCPGDLSGEGNCGCLHAEINAIINAQESKDFCIMYTTAMPCVTCARAIVNARIKSVFFMDEYRNNEGAIILAENRIWTCQISRETISQTLLNSFQNLEVISGSVIPKQPGSSSTEGTTAIPFK